MKTCLILFFNLLLFSSSSAQCPDNTYVFQNQEQVDNFSTMYPDCQDAYILAINGNGVSDLSPLSYLQSIGHLQLNNADNITSLMAFNNTEIISSLNISNCDGLLNLDGIHLSDFQENSWLSLMNNSLLENIDALDDLDLWIKTVTIVNNPNLSQCSVRRICKSLFEESSIINIGNNGEGCNSQEEVEIECGNMGIEDVELNRKIILYPNPTSTIIELAMPVEIVIQDITLYNLIGISMPIPPKNLIDLSPLADGVYFVRIVTNSGSVVKKIVKQ